MEKKLKNINLTLPLFLIWPFGAFIAAFSNLRSRFSGLVYVLFTTLFGFAFSFTNKTADSYRIAWVFDIQEVQTVTETFKDYLKGRYPDLYREIIYSFVHSFTENPKFLFAIYGFVFGFFSYKSLKLLISFKGFKKSIHLFIIVLIFFSTNSIVNINGARFWTAAIICFYAVIKMFYFKEKKWILGLLSTLLIHFSYVFIVPFLILLFLLKNTLFKKNKTPKWIILTYTFTFFASLILSSNVLDLSMITSFLSPSMAYKVDLYNSSRIIEIYEQRSQTLFHTVSKTFGYISRFYIYILIIFIQKRIRKTNILTPRLQQFFSFILLFYSICFIFSIMPSGGRFLAIANLFFFFFLIRFFVLFKSNKLKNLIVGLLPVFSFSILFNIGFLAISLTDSVIWYGNPFWVIFKGLSYKFIY